MKKIEITTSQNVTIQYSLASVWERGLAVIIDMAIVFFSALILWLVFLAVSPSAGALFFYVIVLPVVLLYSLSFELFNNGRSIGKVALQLRVIRMDGRSAGFSDYLMRWCFRGVDIYFSFGSVALVTAISTRYTQRIGDLFANTVVVNVRKSDRVHLRTLMSLEKLPRHDVAYPLVTKLPESTVLLIKETLERQAENLNDAHQEALDLMAVKIQRILKVSRVDDKREFLNKVVSDYVVLTR